VTHHDPDLQELANLTFAAAAVAARRDALIARIAARRRRGDQKAMSEITGFHRETIASIAQRPLPAPQLPASVIAWNPPATAASSPSTCPGQAYAS
jgi:hypothetical protein